MSRYKIVYGPDPTDFATCYANSLEAAKESVVANLPGAQVVEWPERALFEYHWDVENDPDKEHEFVKALLQAIRSCGCEEAVLSYLENHGLV